MNWIRHHTFWMLAAVRSARHLVTFETYIYWSGAIGKAISEALAERARAGVPVQVTIDWAGSVKLDQALVDEVTAAGVEIERYRPLRWYNLGRFNNRTHRKLLTVDGRIAFTGGVGIALARPLRERIAETLLLPMKSQL